MPSRYPRGQAVIIAAGQPRPLRFGLVTGESANSCRSCFNHLIAISAACQDTLAILALIAGIDILISDLIA